MISKLLQGQDGLRVCRWIAVCALATSGLTAQIPAPRIRSEVNNAVVTTLKPSQQPLAQMQNDAGRMPSNMKMNGMTIVFNRSAAQQADLQALLAAQQDPHSPLYHQWLNPDQFAARFGMAQSDIEKVQTWLEQQGFSVDGVSRSRNMIRFTGTIGQVEQAFRIQMHYYRTNGETHFGPSMLMSVPTAIAATIEAVRNVTDFRPRPMHISPHRAFTSSQSGNVFFAPGDIAVTYDISSLYGAGIDGAGQSIAIIGQSAVDPSDIAAFQTAAGLSLKDPVMVIVPGSGSSTVFSGDEGESDLDIEWAGAIAKGATIDFVYTGSNTNYNAFNALEYAIDAKIAPIISVSYGACETAVQQANFSLESAFQQAAAQGQTIVAASGDQGSTACSGDKNGLTTAQEFALAVNYPASSPYVTGVGGTEITAANSVSTNSTYWIGQSSSDVITSAKQYIPEIVWNDDSTQFGLSSTGGGASALFTKPSWQIGVPGIPNDGKRDVPDVSLYSSPGFPGYLFCTSDTSDWNTQPPAQQASCDNGFRDNATGDLTLAGGTSFATPIFAGMLALINQYQQWTGGQGLANSTLYKLASDSSTYASAFHDVTSGNNNCTAGSTYCGSTTGGFSAGAGYDQATGLGSVDLANLAAAWPANSTPLIATSTTVTAANATPDVNANDVITITVAEAGGSGIPSGTVNLSIDGGGTPYNNSGTTTSVTLDGSGTATYTANFASSGVHTIVAQYPGDTTHAPSTGSVFVTIGGASGKGSFTMSFDPTTLTLKRGNQGNETLTVTPAGGYTGTVGLQYATNNDTALANLCLFAGTGLDQSGNLAVTGTSAVTGTIIVDTNASDCISTTGGAVIGRGLHRIPHVKGSLKASNNAPQKTNPLPAGIALAGLLVAGFLGKSSRKLRRVACVIAIASLGLVFSACGGVTRNTPSDPPKGTYTITFTGTDSTNAAITAQSSFTLVIN